MAITRRTFLKRAAVSGITAAAIITGTRKAAAGVTAQGQYATVIDLTKCDGCSLLDTPLCIRACRRKNGTITGAGKADHGLLAAETA